MQSNAVRAIICVFCLCSLQAGCIKPPESDVFIHDIDGLAKPWTDVRIDDAESDFTLAIISDLNGGERERVFEIALAQLGMLRPEFIVTIGDLIDGGSEDRDKLSAEWDSFDARAEAGSAPLFYVGGNHDLTNMVMREVWQERYGSRYYHFVYKNVLHLVLDTEDNSAERMHEIYVARASAIEALQSDRPDSWEESEYYRMPERRYGKVGVEQIAYFQQILARHLDVGWTLLYMHKPAWQSAADTGFDEIETALGDRQYTVFNGHNHSYSHTVRNGRDYIMLGTTGGSQSGGNEMSFDHVTLVRMTRDGPIIANLRMDGILDKTGHIPLGGDELCYQLTACGGE